MNKWKLTVRILIKLIDGESLDEHENELFEDATCYYWMYPILDKKARKRIKRRDKWKIIEKKRLYKT